MKKYFLITGLLFIIVVCKEVKAQTNSDALAIAIKKPKIPDKYTFDYNLIAEAEANGEKITLHFMVKPGANYYGMIMHLNKKDPTKNAINIKDIGRSSSLTLLNRKGEKFFHEVSIPPIKDAADVITIERISKKEINGYTCQGYVINTNNGKGTFYVTQNAAFGFNRGFGLHPHIDLIKKGIEASIVKELKSGLLLESTFQAIGVSNNGLSKMVIKEIVKKPQTIDITAYKKIGS